VSLKGVWAFTLLQANTRMLITQQSGAMIAIFALVATLGLLGVIAVDAFAIQNVDSKACHSSVPFNASKGRCFHP
jgi:hypothetical protein